MGSVLVAGGTGALGAAVVRDLSEAGHAVTATWIVESERDAVAGEMGDAVDLVEADLMDAGAAEAAVASVDDLRAVVCLVGGFASGPKVHETDPDDFMGLLRLNVLPAFLLARAAMPRLAGGAFVGISTRAALRPFPGGASYAVAKRALATLVEALAVEYRDVRCNAVLPSVIDTPANRLATPDADFEKWVKPAEIARVIRFLVSDDSGPTSGALIPVYGRA